MIATIPMVTPSNDRKVLSRLFTIESQENRKDSVKSRIYIIAYKKIKFT